MTPVRDGIMPPTPKNTDAGSNEDIDVFSISIPIIIGMNCNSHVNAIVTTRYKVIILLFLRHAIFLYYFQNFIVSRIFYPTTALPHKDIYQAIVLGKRQQSRQMPRYAQAEAFS